MVSAIAIEDVLEMFDTKAVPVVVCVVAVEEGIHVHFHEG